MRAPQSGEVVRTPPPGVSRELQARVDADAAREIELRRATIVKRCWVPSAAGSVEPRAMDLRVRLAFDADGKQVAIGVGDAIDPRRADVVTCVRQLDLLVSIRPPGSRVGTELTLKLP